MFEPSDWDQKILGSEDLSLWQKLNSLTKFLNLCITEIYLDRAFRAIILTQFIKN